jgi:hypothetical protein
LGDDLSTIGSWLAFLTVLLIRHVAGTPCEHLEHASVRECTKSAKVRRIGCALGFSFALQYFR